MTILRRMNQLILSVRRMAGAASLLVAVSSVHAVPGKMFIFSTYLAHNTISAEGGGTGPISANGANRGSFEQFDIAVIGGNGVLRDGARVFIRCNNSQFVSAGSGTDDAANCNRNAAGTSEIFNVYLAGSMGSGRVIRDGNYIRLRAKSGKFLVTRNSNGTGPIVARGRDIVADKAGMFRLESVNGHLPPLLERYLRMDAFTSSQFPLNPESPMLGCSVQSEDADGVFQENVPGGAVVGIWIRLSCRGSLNGVRISPEFFTNMTLRNGWHILEVLTPDTSVDGCSSSAQSTPAVGSNSPYVKLHMTCPAFKEIAENVVSVRVAGPQGWSMRQ